MRSTFSCTLAFVASTAIGLASGGCKTCDVHATDSSASGSLTYTESVAEQDARIGRIDDGSEGPALLAADRARGRERITGERRVPENHVMGSPVAIAVQSRVTTTFDFEGNPIELTVSSFEVRLLRPPTSGKHDLIDLETTICEHFERNGDFVDECTGARGTIDYRPRDGGFTADIVLEEVGIDEHAATVTGTLHLEHDEYVESSICPDLR